MRVPRSLRGEVRQAHSPNWRPLETVLAAELCSHFMWMFEVELEGGIRLDTFKHRWTRRYLYLDQDGRSYARIWHDDESGDACYREVESDAAILAVFADWERWKPTENERAALRVAVRRRA